MALPTGDIRFSQIISEFGGSARFSHYIRGGSYVPNTSRNGAISTAVSGLRMSQFRNASRVVPGSVTLYSSQGFTWPYFNQIIFYTYGAGGGGGGGVRYDPRGFPFYGQNGQPGGESYVQLNGFNHGSTGGAGGNANNGGTGGFGSGYNGNSNGYGGGGSGGAGESYGGNGGSGYRIVNNGDGTGFSPGTTSWVQVGIGGAGGGHGGWDFGGPYGYASAGNNGWVTIAWT